MARAIDSDALQELCNRRIQDIWNSGTAPVSWAAAYAEFKDDIDSIPTLTPPNELLTEEQLREMVGHPVWIKSARRKEWMLLWGYHGPEVYGRAFIFTRRTAQKEQFPFSELGVTWWPYRRLPEGEEES